MGDRRLVKKERALAILFCLLMASGKSLPLAIQEEFFGFPNLSFKRKLVYTLPDQDCLIKLCNHFMQTAGRDLGYSFYDNSSVLSKFDGKLIVAL